MSSSTASRSRCSLDELLALNPVVERALERLTDSPLVGTMASRFMGRVVGEVLQANKAVAGKVPGLGSLMSFGTSAASKVDGCGGQAVRGTDRGQRRQGRARSPYDA